MNLCRCANGHFYDSERYSTCPHCAGGNAQDNSLTTAFDDMTQPVGGMAPSTPVSSFGASDVTEPVSGGFAPNPGPIPAPAPAPSGAPIASFSADDVTTPLTGGIPTVPLGAPVDLTDDDDDHTVSFFDGIFPGNGAASATESNFGAQVQPVVNKVSTPCVGWLIALSGEHIGTDFRLKVGKNFVGRSAKMDVALTEDKSVSRDRHAIVVYEPKQHLYLVQPGDSSSLVYKNNEVVLTPMILEAYDMITVGDINLLFMPLCGERFNWNDLLEEMKKGK